MAKKDFVAPKKAHLHDAYVTSKLLKEWHNIDSYISKLLENNLELLKNDCFIVCCRSLVTKEIDKLASHKHQHEEEPLTPENKVYSASSSPPSDGILLRKTKKISYAKSDLENVKKSSSSDLEDVEEFKKFIKNKNIKSQKYVCNNFISYESTLCPTVYSATSTLIATPNIIHSATSTLIVILNKPIITKAIYNEYSAHIICAFNTMIHLVKETIEKLVYEKVKNMLQVGNKLVMNDLIVKKLENIFQASYSKIESKVILETNIENNQTMKENRFIFFIQYALLDFVFMFKYLMPKVLDPFRNAFPDIKYMWLEKDIRSIKEANLMFTKNFGSKKKHTVGDVKKLLIMAICSLYRLLGNNLNCNIEDAKNVKTYSIQVIGDRLTLLAISLISKRKYLAVELVSFIWNGFLEQEKLQKKIRSFIPIDNCSENLRKWLHLPDDDISLVTEEDIDEIFIY
ncbi:27391_t:CDS:2 [Dentiscutata erythropus]|uniref:27391_t:CDS:1 n=1 Tax=Dentiscutata erythropus TaxID=1348616 RepID=A0A9N9H627_9GLOM|nr:27391_t:CDS:2 [Dentiscutata erythropus]